MRPGSLKCVAVSSPGRSLADVLPAALGEPADDARRLFDGVWLVYCGATAAEVRDRLAAHLIEGESAFVVEFERWSGSGPAPDRHWLLARGH